MSQTKKELATTKKRYNKKYRLTANGRATRLRARQKYNKSIKAKDRRLQRFFGISIKDYNELFARQNGCCILCNRHQSEFEKGLVVDHDHKTDRVRGLLCGPCNMALGLMQENVDIFQKAISYLTK